MPRQYIRGTIEERLEARTDKSGECWLWTGSIGSHGYGQLQVNGRCTCVHRLSWEVHHGPIPEKMEVAHTCDVRACLNPDHLFIATHRENMYDMLNKGRGSNGSTYGTANPNAKLTDDAVRHMRELRHTGLTCRDLAQRFGVSPAVAHSVISGKTWKHVK